MTKRYYQFFTEYDKDKVTIKNKNEEGMKVDKRVKGKVVCKSARIKFTARHKVQLIEEWDAAVKEKPGLTYKQFTAKKNHLKDDALWKRLNPTTGAQIFLDAEDFYLAPNPSKNGSTAAPSTS